MVAANSMTTDLTILSLLDFQRQRKGGAPALIALNGLEISYQQLWNDIQRLVGYLEKTGIEGNDRIALVFQNGPVSGIAFLAAAALAESAPLNPLYTEEEFRFYFSDLKCKAVLVGDDLSEEAVNAANSLALPVYRLSLRSDGEGGSQLCLGEMPLPEPNQKPPHRSPDDVGLLLHTSGTTARPKLVPLTQRNLCRSAENIAKVLDLNSNDRSLNLMPLFHIHGIVCSLLASLHAGASVVCSDKPDPEAFPTWLARFQPTWYSAVPTIHQAILGALENQKRQAHSLRFIRSSSAALPVPVYEQLVETFGVPVIEAYGMTEAAHQMCSNPLPPGEAIPGSVGIASGPEVAIMDERGKLLPTGKLGEVVIRGDNVMTGYHSNPEANAAAFSDGWFRTGDQGFLDPRGYLHLNGRLKELINRGGEKISPIEVDTVLLQHESVAQAVTFAVPHPTLGEDMAAAVVLHEGSEVSEDVLRDHVFSKLAAVKAPSRIVFVPELPKGPSGKLKRIGLSEVLNDALSESSREPQSDTEIAIAEVWSDVLDRESVGADDNFFYLGGDSLSAGRVRLRIEQMFGITLAIDQLFRHPTVASLAEAVNQACEVESVDDLIAEIDALSEKEASSLADLETDHQATSTDTAEQ